MSEFIRQGLLGLVIGAFILGWLSPKWVVDEYRRRETVKDEIIRRQSALIERLAAKRGGLPDD